jgi:methionyl aminopeptidase
MIEIKSPAEIAVMREAGRLVANILQELVKETAPGVTTKYLDELAERRCRENGVKPAFKGYGGFPLLGMLLA